MFNQLHRIIMVLVMMVIGNAYSHHRVAVEVPLTEKQTFNLWAPPIAWSTEYDLATHGGVMSYRIDLEPIGDTQVRGKVKYYGAKGWEEKEFYDSISFTTGDAWAKVYLRMKGEPLGSAVMVSIMP